VTIQTPSFDVLNNDLDNPLDIMPASHRFAQLTRTVRVDRVSGRLDEGPKAISVIFRRQGLIEKENPVK
jgi:hypothetical protein